VSFGLWAAGAAGYSGPVLRLASVVLLAIPVAFGVIRLVSTGSDTRYLWLAAAAIAGSLAVSLPGRASSGPSIPIARTLLSIAAGAVSATAVAMLLGTKAGPGIAIVAISFGLCTGTGAICAAVRQRQW